MSLINKMLLDLDKRHAAEGGAKTLTQQLRPVQARKAWQRIMWEVIAGLVIGVGWSLWVMYQISPRSVVTDLAFQSQAKRAQAAASVQTPAVAPPSVAPAPAVPAQAAAPQVPSAPAMPAPAPTVPAPAAPGNAEPVKLDALKLATEIATPFGEKGVGAKARAERKSAVEAAPAAKAAQKAKPAEAIAALAPSVSSPAKSANGLPPAKAHGPASIDRQPHVFTPAERAEYEFRKATVLLNQGRVAEAMDGYRLTLLQDSGHAAARQALVGLLLENRRLDEAQQLLQEGLSLNPDRSAYAMLSARIQVERGDLQGAHDLLSRHAGSAANNAEYHAFDAALLQRLGRHKEAVAGYQAALRLAPNTGVWWMGMGISLQADNRGAEAMDAFKRAKAAGLSPDLLSFVDQRMKQLQ